VFFGPQHTAVPLAPPSNPEEWYRRSTWAHVGVKRVAQSVAAIPWIVEEKRGGLWREPDDHALARLLGYVNARDNLYTLKWGTASSLILRGSAYWQMAGGGQPAALFPLPAHLTRPQPSEGNGQLQGFVYFPRGEGTRGLVYAADEVLHFRQWDPLDPWFGQGDCVAAETELNQAWQAGSLVNAILRAGGLQGIFTADRAVDDPDEKRLTAWARKLAAKFRGDRITVIGNNLKWQEVGQQVNETIVKDVPESTRRATLAVFGTPPTMAGIGERASYAQARVEAKVMYETVVIPLDTLLLATVNDGLVRKFGDPSRLRVRHSVDHISWLQDDLMTRVEAAAKFVSGLLGTPNEARAQFLSLAPRPGGDVILGPISTVVIQDARGQGNTVETVTGGGRENGNRQLQHGTVHALPPVRELGPSRRRFGAEARVAIHRGYNRRRDTQAEELAKQIGGWYETLGQQMIERIEADGDLARRARVRQPQVSALVFDVAEATAALEDIVAPALAQLYAESGAAELETVGVDVNFDLDNPRARELLRARQQELQTVARGAEQRVRESLDEGLAQGETVEELTARVEAWTEAGREAYAVTTARTETGIVMNEAAREADRQAGASGFEWLAIVDDRTRDSHAEMDGVTRGMDEPFEVDGHECDGPGDPALPPEEICNCRCTTAAVFGS
jgi:SPP1 gp7 family putative phage head morphogenesis protein